MNTKGQFHGAGKLKITGKESSQNKNDQPSCIKYHQNMDYLVGTFHNGNITGPCKIRFRDGSTIIGNFTNGVKNGLFRKWDPKQQLVYYGFEGGHPQLGSGLSWIKWESYLVFSNYYSFFNEDNSTSWSILVPFDNTKPILIGQVNLGLGLADNLHVAEVTSIKEDKCILFLEWEFGKKLDFFLYQNFKKSRIVKMKKFYSPITNRCDLQNITLFDAWIDALNPINSTPFQFLKQLKAEGTKMNSDKVQQKFLSVSSVFTENNHIHVNMSIWHGKISKWKASKISFDFDLQMHGYCEFDLANQKEDGNEGKHKFLKWSVRKIAGRFDHGKLEGLAMLMLSRGTLVFAHFSKGELHGSAVAYGQQPIFREIEVSVIESTG